MKNPNKDAKGEKRLLHEVQVEKDGSLKNAVVAVTGINDEKFQAEYKGDDVQAELCEFKPYTTVVVANQSSFRVMNNDADPDDPKSVKGVLHNPHSFEVSGPSSTTIFNIALPEKDKGLDKPIKLRKAEQGSVFKMMTAAAALTKGTVTRSTRIKDTGTLRLDKGKTKIDDADRKGMGWMTFEDGVAYSRNVIAAKVALGLGKSTKESASILYDMWMRLGYGKPTGMDVANVPPKLALPSASVVVLVEPRKVCPSPLPLGSPLVLE